MEDVVDGEKQRARSGDQDILLAYRLGPSDSEPYLADR